MTYIKCIETKNEKRFKIEKPIATNPHPNTHYTHTKKIKKKRK